MKDNTRYSGRAAVGAALLHVAAACVVNVVAPGVVVAKSEATSAQIERLELVTATGVHAIDVEMALTPEQQTLGLMYRTSLPDRRGMLFTHETPREITMWMRNTYISLDMVFIRADGTVHRIEERTEPLSERIIASEGPVAAVLEIAGGAAARMGVKPGDKVRHPAFGSKPSP